MKVHIAEEVLNDLDSIQELESIFQLFMEKRHFWDVDNPEEIKNSGWFMFYFGSNAYKQKCGDLEKLYTDQIYSSKNSKMHSMLLNVNLLGGSKLNLAPNEANAYLQTPVCVVVENATSDGAFIEAMIHAYRRKNLLDAQTDNWWLLYHLGGYGECEKRIDDILAKSMNLVRIFVLADSDCSFPGHRTDTIKKIEKCCIDRGIPFHILLKRSIENYLPVNLLGFVPKARRATYKAFLNLVDEQKDFYDMKKGFKVNDAGHAFVPDNQRALFDGHPERILDALCNGFGNDIWKYFVSYRDQITDENIRMTCSFDPYEIERILDRIEQLI